MSWPDKIEVTVLEEDIDHGERESCTKCPIARAVNRNLPSGLKAEVGNRQCDIWNDDYYAAYDLPLIARSFVHRFDFEEPVKPFSFTLTRIG